MRGVQQVLSQHVPGCKDPHHIFNWARKTKFTPLSNCMRNPQCSICPRLLSMQRVILPMHGNRCTPHIACALKLVALRYQELRRLLTVWELSHIRLHKTECLPATSFTHRFSNSQVWCARRLYGCAVDKCARAALAIHPHLALQHLQQDIFYNIKRHKLSCVHHFAHQWATLGVGCQADCFPLQTCQHTL